MVNKKGLSDIVATVLIVLLALAAIAIIWAFLQPTITRGGCQVDQRTKCTLTEFQPLSCVYNPTNAQTGPPEGNTSANITYQLTKGTASKVVGIIEFTSGNSNTTTDSAPPTQAYSSKLLNPVTGGSATNPPRRAKVAAVLSDAKCGETVCDPSTTVIDCTAVK